MQMSQDILVDQLVAQWTELLEQGQFVPPEELCAANPELLPDVQRRIDALDVRVGEETEAAEVGAMMTVVESEASSGLLGTLTLKQEYRKLRFHARGGLGEIYIADDGELQRDVALKFIKPKLQKRRQCREQFLLEAEVTARLDHPGVVPVYGTGKSPDGRLCYAMRFIHGDTLESRIARLHGSASYLQQGSLSRRAASNAEQSPFSPHRAVEFRTLLARFVTVCQTIAYAHNRGILHRDIKPDNVMLGRYGDTLVVDWGLAMPIDRDDSARASGEETLMPSSGSGNSSSGGSGGPVGTPAYMSPEQATGVANLTPASDIFLLGATLYKILTGRSPYTSESARESVTKARHAAFTKPRELNSDIPAPLEAVCLKAMSFAPEKRYLTALDLASDLEHWLADEPLAAYEESTFERIARHSRRHFGRTLLTLAALVVISLIVTGAAVFERDTAQRERAAHQAAHTAHAESLQLSAQFIARTVGRDLQLRWLILQKAAADPELVSILERLAVDGTSIPEDGDPQLQVWLSNHRAATSEEGGPAQASSWFVTLTNGHQGGRTPWSQSIGTYFGFRDYFHGKGRDLPQNSAESERPAPITSPHRSNVYRSKSSDEWAVALSVPVWSVVEDPQTGRLQRRVIGVLAMSQSLGDFDVLKTRTGNDRVVLLIDTKATTVGERGTILHDSRNGTEAWLSQSRETLASETRRVSDAVLNDLIELRGVRLLQHQQSSDEAPLTTRHALREDHQDYLIPDRKWIAACEPIIFDRARDVREDEAISLTEDTGWIVLVQEAATAAAP